MPRGPCELFSCGEAGHIARYCRLDVQRLNPKSRDRVYVKLGMESGCVLDMDGVLDMSFVNCVESYPPPQQWRPDLPFLGASRLCGPAGWLALLLIKAGDVEINPGQTNTYKQVWIYDICH